MFCVNCRDVILSQFFLRELNRCVVDQNINSLPRCQNGAHYFLAMIFIAYISWQ